jgi:hypothetical protein
MHQRFDGPTNENYASGMSNRPSERQSMSFPLADRTDLPDHERKISAESWALLQEALRRGNEKPRMVDPSELEDSDDE